MFKFSRSKDKASDTQHERRQYLRIDASIPVHYFILPQGKEEQLECRCCHIADAKNVGGGGLLVEIPLLTDELFLTTHLIKVQLFISKKNPVEAIARIVSVEKLEHAEGFYLRLEFIKIIDDDRKRIIDYVHRHGKSKIE